MCRLSHQFSSKNVPEQKTNVSFFQYGDEETFRDWHMVFSHCVCKDELEEFYFIWATNRPTVTTAVLIRRKRIGMRAKIYNYNFCFEASW